ncbi:MAG: ATP-binding cassette domain-containing protein [Phycisphaerae bacterium]|nr:ATP-binding cassette domain-containing protein [Phycisphaerae bacterium]
MATYPFGRRIAVSAIIKMSYSLEDGGVLGAVGPNGVGKITLPRILEDLLDADMGHIEL